MVEAEREGCVDVGAGDEVGGGVLDASRRNDDWTGRQSDELVCQVSSRMGVFVLACRVGRRTRHRVETTFARRN